MSAKAILSASVSAAPVYVEDVFSTFLYTGNSSTQTITNGIDLAGKGGLVWIKGRSGATGHRFTDTARGATKSLASDSTAAETTESTGLTSFSSTGFTIGADADYNTSAATYCSWTFREQPKFFDIVTYTGNGVSGRAIPHSLGSVPGCIMVKCTSAGSGFITPLDWWVYHRGLASPSNYELRLNKTNAEINAGGLVATSTTFTVYGTSTESSNSQNNVSGETYVAYLFAHNAGGFGTAGTDNVISCGGYTGNGSFTGTVVNLGFEPQWLMIKRTNDLADWLMFDNMRGVATAATLATGYDAKLVSNESAAENSGTDFVSFTSTGFQLANDTSSINGNGSTYIYIAIRRGPMKTPTVGTSVFSPTYTSSAANPLTVTTNFPVDLSLNRATTGSPTWAFSRLTGANSNTAASTTSSYLQTSSTAAESAPSVNGDSMQSNTALIDVNFNASDTTPKIYWNFRRAPGFFDVVCYTGDGTYAARNHNLTVAPELSITKQRDGSFYYWTVIYATSSTMGNYLSLNRTDAAGSWGSTGFTATQFGLADNTNTKTYVAYLFATAPGVSKVGTYTGTGTTKQIDCGFTAGARFVLIKRTDSTGDWYVWDTARGIISGNDSYLLLNSTAAEVTGTDYIDPLSSGFEISSTAPAAINANGGTYIFLAIA